MKELSDDELRKRLNRINMEKQYEQYVAEANPDKFKKTKKFISDMTGQFVKSVTSKGLEKLSSKLIDSIFKDKDDSPTTKWMYDDLSKLNDKKLAAALKRASSENALRKIINDTKNATKNAANNTGKNTSNNKEKDDAKHSDLDKARDYLVAR
ncbi:MAG: hypothetical protein KIH02_03210 [Parabacteroides sp.]|nr:hypothetical protein [Parabacteroides sp.]